MTIRIVPKEQLESTHNQKTSVVGHTPLLYFPHVKTLYKTRIDRLAQLSNDSPLAEFLNLCKKINELQDLIITSMPLTAYPDLNNIIMSAHNKNCAPLSLKNYSLTDTWQLYLNAILSQLSGYSPQIDHLIHEMELKNSDEKQQLAIALLNGEFDKVNQLYAMFIWSALSCYYVQLASNLPAKAEALFGEQRQFCPVCHSHPSASIIHLGGQTSFRYLHCSLCESEWYVPRVKCTNCEDNSTIHYYSLDKELASVKTECCDNCHSYLKIFYQEQDPELEIIADDLASLLLDEETEKQGFAKTGLNPFLFP